MEDSIKNMLTENFIISQESNMSAKVDYIINDPSSYQDKVDVLTGILKKGVKFGIQKGEFIEECRRERVDKAKEQQLRKRFNEDILAINEEIDEHMIANKYKKPKENTVKLNT